MVDTEEEKSSRWSPEDQRLLLITFNSTVAANVATVVIIGAAISLARQHGLTLGIALAGFAASLAMLIVSYVPIHLLNGFKIFHRKRLNALDLMLSAWCIILLASTLLFFLVVVGKAAGIK